MVGGVEHAGAVHQPRRLQRGDQPPHIVVEERDHAEISGNRAPHFLLAVEALIIVLDSAHRVEKRVARPVLRPVERLGDGIVPEADLVDMAPRGEARPRGHADRGVAGSITEANSGGRQAIEMRRPDHGMAMAAEHAGIVLIRHDHKHVCRRHRNFKGKLTQAGKKK